MTHLQVIATAIEDCKIAEECGADSVELCVAIELGGLTPSVGLVREAFAACSIPIHVLLRPRPGGAVYTKAEFDVMLADARAFADAGCDHFVFAFVAQDGTIDAPRCVAMRRNFSSCHFTFHRAFDLLTDPVSALSLLKQVGIDAVLTSGRQVSAVEGAEQIRALVAAAAGEITIMPAGGINPANARTLVEATGCDCVHGSFSRYVEDPALALLPEYRFGPLPERIRLLDGGQVRAARAAIDGTLAAHERAPA